MASSPPLSPTRRSGASTPSSGGSERFHTPFHTPFRSPFAVAEPDFAPADFTVPAVRTGSAQKFYERKNLASGEKKAKSSKRALFLFGQSEGKPKEKELSAPSLALAFFLRGRRG